MCSISLAIRGIKFKTTFRYHLTLVRMAKIRKTDEKKYQRIWNWRILNYS